MTVLDAETAISTGMAVGAHESRRATRSISFLLACHRGVDAKVLAGAEAQCQDLGRCVGEVAVPVLDELPELGQHLLHLRHGARAVDELAYFRVHQLVGRDEGQQRHRLAGAGGHLQHRGAHAAGSAQRQDHGEDSKRSGWKIRDIEHIQILFSGSVLA